ncbi:MAG TPA: 3-hydroxyacyl-CoA dehydrogenase family protein [Chitinophagales bacterium]|nr:3-hydroxyacyl-CoA dehydrogenase family protein [Chitinophagales bacterium]
MQILITGEPNRAEELKARLSSIAGLEIDYSDGDEDEDYHEYDCIFDLNFDDDPSNLEIYATLRDTPVFVNAVKLTLNEAAFVAGEKIKCKLFGINALPGFISQNKWEVSLHRKFQTPDLTALMAGFGIDFLPIEDRVGMIKPRIIFMIINEACYTLQEGTATIEDIDTAMKLGTNYPFGPLEWCDKIGITSVFETLAALYEDTKDERYKICPLLKTKYLRNETFYKIAKETTKTQKGTGDIGGEGWIG